jgi:dolichol-phosphate mannosyltransferase
MASMSAVQAISEKSQSLPLGPRAIAVVVPCYRTASSIVRLIADIGPEVERIYVVDDQCPEGSGKIVREKVTDSRVTVIMREENGGVGAAVMTGYRQAIADGATVIVKLDGDGQMSPALIPRFVRPILDGRADYTKGNRFYHPEDVRVMPWARKLGNAALSFLSKASTGYWDIFDPTNGFTAVHGRVAAALPLSKIAPRYFFESDMLFRLNTIRAVVMDIPMEAKYGGENSSLRILKVLPEFAYKHAKNTAKRIIYNHFLRGFSVASLELVLSFTLGAWALGFGSYHWWKSAVLGVGATAGTVMVAAMPGLAAIQLFLAFVNSDVQTAPHEAIHRHLE